MADFTPPPTYAEPVLVDEKTQRAAFNPIWLKWFLDVAQFISVNSGGGGGGGASHNLLGGLQGGGTGEYYHLTATDYTTLLNGEPIGGLVRSRDSTILMRTINALANSAAANVATLTNAPVAGNPTKWISINDAGTIRRIPVW